MKTAVSKVKLHSELRNVERKTAIIDTVSKILKIFVPH